MICRPGINLVPKKHNYGCSHKLQTREASQCKHTAQSCMYIVVSCWTLWPGMMDSGMSNKESQVQAFISIMSGNPVLKVLCHWQGPQDGWNAFQGSINIPFFVNMRSSFILSTYTMALLVKMLLPPLLNPTDHRAPGTALLINSGLPIWDSGIL